MDSTDIIATWIHRIEWRDGWEAMQSDRAIRQPSIWVINPMRSLQQWAKYAEQLLNSEETTKAMRFHHMDHRQRFKAAHTVLRLVLGLTIDSDPASLRFAKGHHNKPRLETPEHTPIQFNLSYTENRAMIGVNHGYPIGVDLEWLQRPLDIESMLDACFSIREIAFIRSRKEEMHHRFFTLWTRKEAILKLTGEGIGDHLPYFEVLDGTCRAEKRVIGGQPPRNIYLYSFSVEEGFIGCFASPTPITQCSFYRL